MAQLKRELEELRNSSQHSFSSTPTSAQSYTSDRGSFMDPAHLQVFNELLKVSLFLLFPHLPLQFLVQFTKTCIFCFLVFLINVIFMQKFSHYSNDVKSLLHRTILFM